MRQSGGLQRIGKDVAQRAVDPATLVARRQVSPSLRDTANGLLTHLSLLFVPAGAGVMIHAQRIRGEALPIVAALVVSTALTIAVTAWVFARARRKAP